MDQFIITALFTAAAAMSSAVAVLYREVRRVNDEKDRLRDEMNDRERSHAIEMLDLAERVRRMSGEGEGQSVRRVEETSDATVRQLKSQAMRDIENLVRGYLEHRPTPAELPSVKP